MLDFLILGGDDRMLFLYKILSEKYIADIKLQEENSGHTDIFESVKKAKNIILPIPSTRDGNIIFAPKSKISVNIADIQSMLEDDQRIFYRSYGKFRKYYYSQ